jgi:DNA topoisomerase-2
MEIKDFLEESFSQSALYMNFRNIGSAIDGLKPSSRKVIFSVRKFHITAPLKVSRLAPRAGEATEYLHGETSMEDVIINMARSYVGSNNLNLLHPEGNFGSRFSKEASASRYIFTHAAPCLDALFCKDDDEVLIHQEFEGTPIEPRFFIPTLPVILVNGSEGIGNGYAQKILPRNPAELSKAIKEILEGKPITASLNPWYKGYRGTIKGSKASWVVRGSVDRKNTTTLIVTEIPTSYSLASYRKVLDDLVDNKIIKDYDDESEDDNFRFVVSVTREFSAHPDDWVYKTLKLETSINENYTCIDKDNKVVVFKSAEELLKYYVTVRLHYYELRKENKLKEMKEQLNVLNFKLLFISGVIQGDITVNNRTKKQIEQQLEDSLFVKVNESYDYLLSMPIYALTKEKYDELREKAAIVGKEYTSYEGKTTIILWMEDLSRIF